ncbi:MAG TPA: transcription termination/antitermination NusG family protein [Blastocatellia bacterium]|nr:transcription termination/antitermination NusG family protein [Blastocatellia bacterium]
MEDHNSEMGSPLAQWFAVHVCSRREKVVERVLSEKGFETFLPLTVKRSRVSARRFREAQLPLFPGYLFSRFHPSVEHLYRIGATKGVVGVVRASATPVPVPDADIEAIKIVLASKIECSTSPTFSSGQKVIIKEGPLRGLQGEVLHRKNRHLFVIKIALIRRMLELDISPFDLEIAAR